MVIYLITLFRSSFLLIFYPFSFLFSPFQLFILLFPSFPKTILFPQHFHILTIMLTLTFFFFHRNHFVYIHAIPLNASDNYQCFNWFRHSFLWLCYGSQCIHLAERENDMCSESKSIKFKPNSQSAAKSVTMSTNSSSSTTNTD